MIIKREIVSFKLRVLTGMHIGGLGDVYGIGGVDSPVIKNPITGEPIIPGSSLKGKLRYLYENTKGFSVNVSDNFFGYRNSDKNKEGSITRVIFRDLCLSKESKDNLEKIFGKNTFTEIKAENVIDEKCKATPRFIERVPAGVVFDGEIIINYCENDSDWFKVLNECFDLLIENYLGGSGSRGYGKVQIESIEKKEK